MPQLIRTPIIDRNGKATTVHRRAEPKAAGGIAALSAAKPTVTRPAEGTDEPRLVRIKASQLGRWYPYENSLICEQNMYHWMIDGLWNGRNGDFLWEPRDMEIPDESLYGYLRLGLDLTEAAMLHCVGTTPEMVGSDEHFARYLPGRLGRRKEGDYTYRLRNQQAIAALQQNGVPAERAYALLENRLQDGHFGGVLDFDQVVEVLGKIRYPAVQGTGAQQKSTQTVDALVRGDIPFELVRSNTGSELGRLAEELHLLDPSKEFKRRLAEDRDLTIRVVSHALKGLNRPTYGWDRLISRAFKLYEERPDEFFEVKALELLTHGRVDATTGETTHSLDVDDIRFIEDVAKGIRGKKGWSLLWDGYKPDKDTSLRLSHWDIKELRDAGASVERAKELLIEQRMDPKLAVAVVRDGIAAALFDGAL